MGPLGAEPPKPPLVSFVQSPCLSSEWECGGSGGAAGSGLSVLCVSLVARCNGIPDCPLGDDELGCPPPKSGLVVGPADTCPDGSKPYQTSIRCRRPSHCPAGYRCSDGLCCLLPLPANPTPASTTSGSPPFPPLRRRFSRVISSLPLLSLGLLAALWQLGWVCVGDVWAMRCSGVCPDGTVTGIRCLGGLCWNGKTCFNDYCCSLNNGLKPNGSDRTCSGRLTFAGNGMFDSWCPGLNSVPYLEGQGTKSCSMVS